MPKERSINPAQAQRKADKQKEIARSRKVQQAQRNEKLARRNPERLERQIDELKELDSRGALRPKDKEKLAQLEKDARGIRRAREALGDKAPQFAPRRERDDARDQQRERRQHLGKRQRDTDIAHDSGSETDPEVRAIPMPRDTPPPISREPFRDSQIGPDGQRKPHALPSKPVSTAPPAQTVYSSAPQIRDLRKAAVQFLPSAVAQHQNRVQGKGRLLEPEEIERLEKAGYLAAEQAAIAAERESRLAQAKTEVIAEDIKGDQLDAEARRLEAELNDIFPADAEAINPHQVQVEEVADEDA